MSVKLLTEHHLEFLSLKEGCTGSSESTLVDMSNSWKSHAAAQNFFSINGQQTENKPEELFCLFQHFEEFLKILNSGIMLKTFNHEDIV